ncbi:A/G-specific adenine glycosylase [Antarcticibacterium flavum]|uniref:Adenine DNA glycosylase n=1 Tax=Antarcticibacterium flavum TaxID=2058175 RepID=A0A5B7X4Z5_9FLAO|nr:MULTISPECIES: A/G-specific adenine glycosylase [Antarcticibacterium]MCM4160515.1 A/G-specific adenine glycosylase [Antarcticibacterium sp. W02-3]QCY69821.1 A/G-specific adenine glycosylase [Antarcticibacterium flavum]
MDFAKTLIFWYLKNKRELPWRQKKDPYHIWLSEIILQQTRIEQGLPYYLKFINAYPNVFELASAPLEHVLKNWQGLGYYSRARNLHTAAKYIVEELDGVFPLNYKGLKELKGVGDYTASAIASICYHEPVAVVDGNVYRVLARYFKIDTPINSTAGIREFKALARELLDRENPGDHNQSIMEFGAIQCKPQQPLCDTCPFSGSCLALKTGKIKDLPVKLKKAKVKKRYFNYLVFLSEENKTILEQREGRGIWEGLFQFPLLETKDLLKPEEIFNDSRFLEMAGKEVREITLFNESPVIHKLSHQHLYTRFWLIEKKELDGEGIPAQQLKEYPVPVLIANFLKEYDFTY